MGSASFFDESTEQSQVKAEIVAKYLFVWAKVVIPSTKRHSGKIAYIDLFAGPGRYNDGTKSTPLLILERAINDPDIRDMLVTIFSDSDPTNARSLKNAIFSLPKIETLKHEPQVHTDVVNDDITKLFQSTSMIPSLTFLDPWGYKGLSCQLITSVIKDWGCDCIIFFNYNRINMGINNAIVKPHMNALFGEERVDKLICETRGKTPIEREEIVLGALSDSLIDLGGKYILPFRFRGRNNRISHHLVFITKHIKGYSIMKDIMAKSSSYYNQGVPSFEYSIANKGTEQLYMFDSPLDQLEEDLIRCFCGKSLSVLDIFDQHNIGKPYIKSNYKTVLLRLEEKGCISAEPPMDRRRKDTISDSVVVTFPS